MWSMPKQSFDIPAIRDSGLQWAYDAMYGAGQNVMRRLFPGYYLFACRLQPKL
jgi:phosphomannomutase